MHTEPGTSSDFLTSYGGMGSGASHQNQYKQSNNRTVRRHSKEYHSVMARVRAAGVGSRKSCRDGYQYVTGDSVDSIEPQILEEKESGESQENLGSLLSDGSDFLFADADGAAAESARSDGGSEAQRLVHVEVDAKHTRFRGDDDKYSFVNAKN